MTSSECALIIIMRDLDVTPDMVLPLVAQCVFVVVNRPHEVDTHICSQSGSLNINVLNL